MIKGAKIFTEIWGRYMVSIIVGIALILFTVFAVLPGTCGLNWGADVIAFLKGMAPVFAAFVGLVCLFIGAADIKDKAEAKKEEKEAKLKEENDKNA